MSKSERFRNAFDYLQSKGKVLRKKALADTIGYTRSVVSNAYNGKEDFATPEFLVAFCKAFPEINLEWLLTGEGDMLQAPQMARDGFLQVMANDTKPYTQESRDGQISRLLDMIDERDAKIEALLKENAGLRAELASAGIYGKKHG